MAKNVILCCSEVAMRIGCWLVVKAEAWRRRRQPVRESVPWEGVEAKRQPTPRRPLGDRREFWIDGKRESVTAPIGTIWGPGGRS